MLDTNVPGRPDDADRPLHGDRVIIAGAGRVGRSVCHWLSARGARIPAIAGRQKPEDWVDFSRPFDQLAWRSLGALESDNADLLILAVADGALERVATELASRPQARIVLHVSGHFDAAALASLAKSGSEVGSWHPLRAFPAVSRDVDDASGVAFAIDGDEAALAMAERLTAALEARAFEVSGEQRRLYHLAASLAAGGVVTVLAAVDRLRHQAGLPDVLMSSYRHLTSGAIAQLPITPPIPDGAMARAITGPAARGDQAMLDRQRAAVAAQAPELLPLLDALSEATKMLLAIAPLSGDQNRT